MYLSCSIQYKYNTYKNLKKFNSNICVHSIEQPVCGVIKCGYYVFFLIPVFKSTFPG